jgi:hypothetical protein
MKVSYIERDLKIEFGFDTQSIIKLGFNASPNPVFEPRSLQENTLLFFFTEEKISK